MPQAETVVRQSGGTAAPDEAECNGAPMLAKTFDQAEWLARHGQTGRGTRHGKPFTVAPINNRNTICAGWFYAGKRITAERARELFNEAPV